MAIWSIIYIVAVLLANYTATWFLPLPVFGMVAVGTLIFGATFTARDYVHRLGRHKVYTMIVVTAIMSAGLSLIGAVPGRIITASVIAIVLSEIVDTEVYQKLIEQRWLIKVAGSNMLSVPIDSLLFNLVAFAGVLPFPLLISVIFGEVVVKYAVGLIVALWRFTQQDNDGLSSGRVISAG